MELWENFILGLIIFLIRKRNLLSSVFERNSCVDPPPPLQGETPAWAGVGGVSGTYHASLPDDAHAVLHATHSMWDLGEVLLAHSFLLGGERPVV